MSNEDSCSICLQSMCLCCLHALVKKISSTRRRRVFEQLTQRTFSHEENTQMSVTMTMRIFHMKKPARRDALPAAENAECCVFGDLFSSILIFLHVFKYLCRSHSCSPVKDCMLSADLSLGSSSISTSFSVRSDVKVTVRSLTEQRSMLSCDRQTYLEAAHA